MPIYEYQCRECGAVCEFLHLKDAQEPINCSNCGGNILDRILSPAAVLHQASRQLSGHTCCGRQERCEAPPCSSNGECKRK